jgi:arylsulfatase A-like enzyme
VEPTGGNAIGTRAIIFVWDGLRPDSVTATDTPNLFQMEKKGVAFQDNHSTYPTFTMMNAASFATGAFPGTTGFFGNTFWAKGAMGNDATATPFDFNQPVFTEDYALLEDLDTFYGGQLLLVGSLFQAAQTAGKTTAAVGKSGAAFLQDRKRGGVFLDEKMASPLAFAQELQAANLALPKLTPNAYAAGKITLAATNGDPTAAQAKKVLADGVSSDPTDASGTPFKTANEYLMNVYVTYILPKKQPDLSLIWLRNPDSTQHNYGPGTANARDALHAQDLLLGQLQAGLTALGLDATTNLIVVSDHGHSSVSGPTSLYPLRGIDAATHTVSQADPAGYSVSGDVRLADLLTRGGFTAYDGSGCVYSPVMSGIKADGSQVYPTKTDDAAGTLCGGANKKYSTPSYKVPAALPAGAIVVAANGGSDYLYVPDHDAAKVAQIVAFLQTREEIGPIFVDTKYPNIKGTITLDTIKVENAAGRSPDIIISYTFDETAVVQGMPGVELESMSSSNNRGMHGSFSPIDVHNTLIALGPDFRAGFTDTLPTGNVDVAPTVAYLFGLPLPGADGRPLYEALATGLAVSDYQIEPTTISSTTATGLAMKLPTDPDGKDGDPSVSSYHTDLHTRTVSFCGKSHVYFDYAKAVRQ